MSVLPRTAWIGLSRCGPLPVVRDREVVWSGCFPRRRGPSSEHRRRRGGGKRCGFRQHLRVSLRPLSDAPATIL